MSKKKKKDSLIPAAKSSSEPLELKLSYPTTPEHTEQITESSSPDMATVLGDDSGRKTRERQGDNAIKSGAALL